MGLWLQRNTDGRASPIEVKRLGLVLLGQHMAENLEPLLCPPIPAVDGVIALSRCALKGVTVPITHVRRAASAKDLVMGQSDGPYADYDHLLWLRAGESLLLGGDVAILRQTAQQARGACLLPVHSPLPGPLPLTLLGLEPRWVAPNQPLSGNPGFLGIPIEGATASLPEPPAPREDLAWVLLYRANRALSGGDVSRGLALLDHIVRHTAERMPPIAGVAVRNGLAAAIASGDRRLVARWCERALPYRSYKEVELYQALVPFVDGDWTETVDRLTSLLQADVKKQLTRWISGGGETTYRALTFRGIAHERAGIARNAVADWATALQLNSSYLPPLAMLAKERLHLSVLDNIGLRWHLPGKSKAVQAMIATAYAKSSDSTVLAELTAELTSPGLHGELRRLARTVRPARAKPNRPAIHWEGAFFTQSSLARINRELATRLLASTWQLGAIPTEPSSYTPGGTGSDQLLSAHLWHDFADPSLTIRHCWPPLLHPTRAGKRVIYLPWEFGAVPREWVGPLRDSDEVWVYSEWVRQGLIRSGIDGAHVVVIPCGVDPNIYRIREGPAPTCGGAFNFLYVGGTIARKGYDLALEAFLAEFGPDEAVTLTIKEFGSDTFYRGSNGTELVRIAAAATAGRLRRIVVVDQMLSDEALADLYRSVDLLVAPYRAEGFCMPALEAMACGTPAILPTCGPALDYTEPDTALMVNAERVLIGDYVDHMQLEGEAALCHVTIADLRRTMRWAFLNRADLGAIGHRAARDVAARFTWNHAADKVERRLCALLDLHPTGHGIG